MIFYIFDKSLGEDNFFYFLIVEMGSFGLIVGFIFLILIEGIFIFFNFLGSVGLGM